VGKSCVAQDLSSEPVDVILCEEVVEVVVVTVQASGQEHHIGLELTEGREEFLSHERSAQRQGGGGEVRRGEEGGVTSSQRRLGRKRSVAA
jgi:hypothetical protein